MASTIQVDTIVNAAGSGATNFTNGITLASGSTLNNYTNATSFTPTMFLGATSQTLSTAIGRYWRVGNILYYSLRVTLGGAKSGSGAVTIQGLPVSSANINSSIRYGVVLTNVSGITGMATKGTVAYGEVGNNTSTISLSIGSSGGSSANMVDTDISTTVDMFMSGWYAV